MHSPLIRSTGVGPYLLSAETLVSVAVQLALEDGIGQLPKLVIALRIVGKTTLD